MSLYMQRVISFLYAGSCQLFVYRNLSAFCIQEVVSFLYTGSCQLCCNLTDMCQKPSACIGLHVGMVSKSHIIVLLTETMTVPSHPHVSISTIGAELEKIVRVEPHCSHGYKFITLQPHCTSQLFYNSHHLQSHSISHHYDCIPSQI
jgi:hypothetical protein